MPKTKNLTKNFTKNSKLKTKFKTLGTAEDYLAGLNISTMKIILSDSKFLAGVDFEEAGEKWRGGDLSKSLRFFNRAIDMYDDGLKKFSNCFDLAYNKSRVMYELTQHPKLIPLLSGTLHEHLQAALQSRVSCYHIDINHTILELIIHSNTAQVMTSIVEELDGSPNTKYSNLLPILEEALSLFQRCLELQETNLREHQSKFNNTISSQDPLSLDLESDEEGGVSLIDYNQNIKSHDERWATVIEPITDNTLLDTILASLGTLTTYCQIVSTQDLQESSNTLCDIMKYVSVLNTKFDLYLKDKDRVVEAQITRASFKCALAAAQFHLFLTDLSSYSQAVYDAFVDIDLVVNPKGLCEYAEALIFFNNVLRIHANSSSDIFLQARWRALTQALDYLSSASKIPDVENLEKIHLARGDVELLRYQLGQTEIFFRIAKENSSVLLKNAEKYYRGSSILSRNVGATVLAFEASLKEALALGLSRDMKSLGCIDGVNEHGIPVLKEALDEGLILPHQLGDFGIDLSSI